MKLSLPKVAFLAAFLHFFGSACQSPPVSIGEPIGDSVISLLGETYPPLRLPPEVKHQREAELEAARTRLSTNETDPEAWIWVGRRLAYLGRFSEAIDLYSAALLRFPRDPRLLRHRGHRYLTLRHLQAAHADLTQAAALTAGQPDEVEFDGLPNPRNEPRTTLQGNIWYHLGLCAYCQGNSIEAQDAFERALAIATNDDAWVAAAYWLVLARLRNNLDPTSLLAEVTPTMDVIENRSYLALLLAFRDNLDLDHLLQSAPLNSLTHTTLAFGVAAWKAAHNQRPQSQALLHQIIHSPNWHSFAHLAAESTLAPESPNHPNHPNHP